MSKFKVGILVQITIPDDWPKASRNWRGVGLITHCYGKALQVTILDGPNKGLVGVFDPEQLKPLSISKAKRDMILDLYGSEA